MQKPKCLVHFVAIQLYMSKTGKMAAIYKISRKMENQYYPSLIIMTSIKTKVWTINS